MKNGISHTVRTQINAFNPLFFESLYTQIENIAEISKGIVRNIIRSNTISSIKSAIIFPPLFLID